MRRVTLAIAFDGHAADETIEVPDNVARRLLHDGKARRADDEVAAERDAAEAAAQAAAAQLAGADDDEEPEPVVADPKFNYMKISELRAFAAEHEIVIPEDVRKRPAIAEFVRAAWSRASDTKPASGTKSRGGRNGR